MKRFALFFGLLLLSMQCLALTFTWTAPTQRENGDKLTVEELSLYEIRGKDATGKTIWTYVVKDGTATSLIADIPKQVNIVTFDIAVADTNGVYSRFVPIEDTRTTTPKILAPTEGEIY